MAKNNNKLSQWSLTVLRVAVAITFMYHGYGKLFVPGGFTGTVGFFGKIGIPFPAYAALASGVAEFFGGILILLGVLTKISSIALIIDMLVAFFKVHIYAGFSVSKGGYEEVMLLVAGLIVILVNGAGKFSVGKFFKRKSLE